ncbi:hypothetical protein P280DRAFT_511730 [Massarina eburnea CBS 473.64]|uniref:Uncharacterized protein n=1 Tax=Massarina eburnea CBS 473.64 TaxID=1395130 RepID=A0A6A6RHV9_9PLEO|nr:hypothetical protein P280DRAFT_511730 [Massarina eburnea CBS 473.64]
MLESRTKNTLFRLPAELRNEIYSLTLGNLAVYVDPLLRYCHGGKPQIKDFRIRMSESPRGEIEYMRNWLALTAVCRRLREETRLLPFTLNSFAVTNHAMASALRRMFAFGTVIDAWTEEQQQAIRVIKINTRNIPRELRRLKGLRKVIVQFEITPWKTLQTYMELVCKEVDSVLGKEDKVQVVLEYRRLELLLTLTQLQVNTDIPGSPVPQPTARDIFSTVTAPSSTSTPLVFHNLFPVHIKPNAPYQDLPGRIPKLIMAPPHTSAKIVSKHNSNVDSPFLRLPAEIRNNIYEHALGGELVHAALPSYNKPRDHDNNGPIAKRSKAIRRNPPSKRPAMATRSTTFSSGNGSNKSNLSRVALSSGADELNHSPNKKHTAPPSGRDKIKEPVNKYNYGFRINKRFKWKAPFSPNWLALLRVNRQLYNETHLLPFNCNAFGEAHTPMNGLCRLINSLSRDQYKAIQTVQVQGWMVKEHAADNPNNKHIKNMGAKRKNAMKLLTGLKTVRVMIYPKEVSDMMQRNEEEMKSIFALVEEYVGKKDVEILFELKHYEKYQDKCPVVAKRTARGDWIKNGEWFGPKETDEAYEFRDPTQKGGVRRVPKLSDELA